jgi:hypothetical protein
MNEYSPKELLDVFNSGKKMDILPLASIVNNAAHMEYNPTFISRDAQSSLSKAHLPA